MWLFIHPKGDFLMLLTARSNHIPRFFALLSFLSAMLLSSGCKTVSTSGELASSVADNEKYHCVDGAANKLGIDYNMMTDPALLRDILANDMYLSDFKPLMARLENDIRQPVSLRPMFNEVRDGIVNRFPPVNEFLCVFVAENLIQDIEKGNNRITRTVHHNYLLDKINRLIFDDWQLMDGLYDHFLKKREEKGIKSDFVRSTIGRDGSELKLQNTYICSV
jgi:hypothetical protein